MNDYLNDRLKSRNIHSEIVFSLSPNNNVSLLPTCLVNSDSSRSVKHSDGLGSAS